jgi:hypothetical protein
MTNLPCKDCKYCKPSWFPSIFNHYEFATCHRPGNYTTSTVSGHLIYETSFCDISRKYDHICGVEGKHFEPKRSKEVQYYDIYEKKKKDKEVLKKMFSDLKKANAKVYESLDCYMLPDKPGHFSLKDLKEKYLSGEVSQVEKELQDKQKEFENAITAQVRTEVKKDAATLIRKKYKGQKLIMEKPESLAKLIEDMK